MDTGFNKNRKRERSLIVKRAGVFIIAEIGVNHNGDITLAKKLIDAAVNCRANAVKFQTFSAKRLASPSTPKVPYQCSTSDLKESHFAMLKKLELSKNDHIILKKYCKKKAIEFCSTPYSVEDAQFLESLGVNLYKVASADITDRRLHEYLSGTGKEVIVATGMSTMDEIAEILKLYEEKSARDKVILLQCVSAYPAKAKHINLKVMHTLEKAFGCRVGFSDHTITPFAAFAATAMGAAVVEKHFTLDRKMQGPDHAASCEPKDFSYLVKGIREIEALIGDGVKKVCSCEEDMRKISRKSIVLSRDVPKGKVIGPYDITAMRPGTGVSPMRYEQIIGRRVKRKLFRGAQIRTKDLE